MRIRYYNRSGQNLSFEESVETMNEKHMFSNRDLWKLLIPLMIEQLLASLMGTVDTMMVSKSFKKRAKSNLSALFGEKLRQAQFASKPCTPMYTWF